MKETTWQQDAAKVLNALAEHESEPPVRVQPVVMRELTDDEDVYWVRTDEKSGKVTAALSEKHFSKEELENELNVMRRFGPVRRILASRVTIGEALKASA